jgi:hypothetical protein
LNDIQSQNLYIPVVDFSKFQYATSQSDRKSTADKIVGAFKDSGFIYLREHGISADVVKNTFSKVSTHTVDNSYVFVLKGGPERPILRYAYGYQGKCVPKLQTS